MVLFLRREVIEAPQTIFEVLRWVASKNIRIYQNLTKIRVQQDKDQSYSMSETPPPLTETPPPLLSDDLGWSGWARREAADFDEKQR